jgi:hypothetical protein
MSKTKSTGLWQVEEHTVDENGRLFLAAPKMLEALRDWMRWHDEDSLIARDRALRLTRVLIAKVEGRES